MNRNRITVPRGRALLGLLAATVPLVVSSAASARERFWLGASASSPIPVNGPYDRAYGIGFAGALSAYHSVVPALSLGARVGGGALEEDDDFNPPEGTLGFGTLSASMRIRPFGRSSSPERSTGLWLDLAGGGALLDGSVRGAIDPGLGYTFSSEYVGIGPFGRYTQIIETGDSFGGEDARLVMVGLEMTFLDGRTTPMMPTAAPIATDTRQLEQELAAAKQREEAMRIEQQRLEAEKQRLAAAPVPAEPERVLDAQLFFDYNSAVLRSEGKEKLRQIAGNYLEKRNQWQVIRIQGNADDRGPDAYNLRLSADRATAARLYWSRSEFRMRRLGRSL